MGDQKTSSNISVNTGAGFWGLLTIAFIVMKLTGVISWSWAWVLAPVWIPASMLFGFIVFRVVTAVLFNRPPRR